MNTVTFNGNSYKVPTTADLSGWGTNLTTYLSALAAGASGLNVTNTFTATQLFPAVGLVPGAVPTQTVDAQVYAGTDGNLYALPSSANPAVPVQLTPGAIAPPRFVVKTANYSVLAADNGLHFLTVGASGAVQFTLPTGALGLEYTFTCSAAQTMTIVGSSFVGPGSLSGTVVTIFGASAGSRYTLVKVAYDGAAWNLESVFGTAFVA